MDEGAARNLVLEALGGEALGGTLWRIWGQQGYWCIDRNCNPTESYLYTTWNYFEDHYTMRYAVQYSAQGAEYVWIYTWLYGPVEYVSFFPVRCVKWCP
jgi:hypothetical protein